MNWAPYLIVGGIGAAFFLVKKSRQVSAREAAAYLQNGALVIDVRTPGEFRRGHLPMAINLPLDEIGSLIPQRVQDKNQVLLLHCASGMRSGIAKSKLHGLGYANVFNLGSYGRAESLLRQAVEPAKQTR